MIENASKSPNMVQSNVKLGFVESVFCLCTNLQSDSQQKIGSKLSIASQINTYEYGMLLHC